MPLSCVAPCKMAPSTPDSTLTPPAVYTAFPVHFSEERTVQHYLYAKEHLVRGVSDKTLPLNRTLFVINIPGYVTKNGLSEIFSSCGPVESVDMLDKPGPSVKGCSYFNQKISKGFREAYIVFTNASGIKKFRTIKNWTPLVISKKDNFVKAGIHKWIEDYENSLTDVAALQVEIDQYMQNYDKKVTKEEEQAKETEGMPDAEGWITVTRKGRRPGLARTEAINLRLAKKEAKKRAQKELLNFYSWQHRNQKKEHLAELRKRFEEDKQKIAVMRAQRKFRPY